MRSIKLPLTKDVIKTLRVGQEVLLNGTILTARDAAHKRLVEALKQHRRSPVPIKGETIYYTGPTPTMSGNIIGSCGPTTSARMDPFVAVLLKYGLLGMIGKGERSREVDMAIKKAGAVYFVTVGGAGAYLSERVKKNNIIAYADLGTEAIRRLVIEDFPAVVSVV